MQASYGYTDGTGTYYIIIDTDKCDGCARCVDACPQDIFEVAPDDYGETVARVKEKIVNRISYVCPGARACSNETGQNCQAVCEQRAISHTW